MRAADLIGVVAIFLLFAYVGYRSSKQVKNMSDFTLASGNLGKIKSAFSLAATEFGGSSLVGAMALCYTVGVAGAWWDWSAVPAFVLLGIFFIGKIKLPHMVTVTDFFEKRYCRKAKLFASIMHLLAIATQLSTQFMVGAVALNGVLGVPKAVGLLVSVGMVVLYTMAGGLVAVVNTDVVQFVIIVVSILVALPISLYHAGGFGGLREALPDSFFSFGSMDMGTVASWCLFCFFTYATSQHYIQRIFASKDKATARFSFIFTGVSYFFYGLCVSIIGICIAALIPGLQDPNQGYSLLIRDFMPAGVAGLILGGIFAASMSTASSMLLAASTLFVNDIYEPLASKRKDHSEQRSLKTIRVVTFAICALSLVVSMLMNNIVNIMYLGGLFYSTAVFFPLIIGLFWRRATAPAAFCSMIAAVVAGLVSEFFLAGQMPGLLGMPSNMMAALTSLAVLLIGSLLTKKPDDAQLAFLKEA